MKVFLTIDKKEIKGLDVPFDYIPDGTVFWQLVREIFEQSGVTAMRMIKDENIEEDVKVLLH